MTSSNESLFDKIFRKNKKSGIITGSTTSKNGKASSSSSSSFNNDNDEISDSRYVKTISHTPNNSYPINIQNSNSLYETSTAYDCVGSFDSNTSNNSSVNLRNNLNYDLSTIREEDSNRLTMEISTNSNQVPDISIEDVLHQCKVNNYYTPTFCDFCGKLLVGLFKQGLKCQVCELNFHKHCIPVMPRICNKQLNIMIAKQGSNANSTKSSNLLNKFIFAETEKQIELEHTFIKRKAFTASPYASICEVCQSRIINEKSYLECKDCQISVHAKCKEKTKKNCKPIEIDDEEDAMSISTSKMSIDGSDSESDDVPEMHSLDDSNDTGEVPDQDSKKHFRPRQQRRTQIGLQRISQRVKKTSGYFWSGHMYYYTNKNIEPITHYWKLDSKSITIYDSYRLEKKLNEIPIESIKIAKLSGLHLNNKDENQINDQKCLFVLKTDVEIFFCGMGSVDQNSSMNVLARNFYNIFKMVYLPYANRHGKRVSIKISAPKYEEKSLNEEYTINPQDLLGSGQFGQVYGGICKATRQPVAIKVIDKTRFKDFHAETSIFQNEITILYNVQHPGIVKLFALFDEVDQLYIVTEKLSTDMLEMILNKKPPRLSERVSKFIIYQILIALNKLHDRNIAHCDLKPENILLVENTEFPQVKICDFGYAKIIGENSFRRSMVGTPAYSPPELKQKRLYNNSIDMWSMGVIVYVSLSGTFPFEEDRDIYEQIMNSNFMFPEDPWRLVSKSAIDLINHFLQVKIDRRMSVNKALQHQWFSEDFQLYLDLLDLEKRVGQKWLTTKTQEDKWTQSIHL